LSLVLAFFPARARGDIGIMIADPTGEGSSAYTHAGHALVYLSGVCAESPIRARLCNPGEQGSVVTIFPNFHELKPYEWNMVPLSLYIDGTVTPGDRLLYGSRSVKAALAEKARSGNLQEVCGKGCPTLPHSYWRDLVAATIERDVFIYAVKTTRNQDEAAVRWINAQPNTNHYNGLTSNCAMFAQSLMNTIFPHSVHRDLLNDIGLMSPKAAAHSFSRWAHKHPELGFYSMHFEQKPGSIRRSGTASNGTEAAIHIKKYLIPAALIGDHEVAGSFFVAYLLTGRFNLYKEYARYPTPTLTGLEAARQKGIKSGDPEQTRVVEEEISAERAAVNGTDREWATYRQRFAEMTRDAGLEREKEKTRLKQLDTGKVFVDAYGNAWLTYENHRRVGITSTNVLSKGSDPELALNLLMWRIEYVLKAKNRMRPSMQEFRQDWTLFEEAYARSRSLEAAAKETPKIADDARIH
jgi:hypothetical protein